MEIIRYVSEDMIEELKAHKISLLHFVEWSTIRKGCGYDAEIISIKIIIPDEEE